MMAGKGRNCGSELANAKTRWHEHEDIMQQDYRAEVFVCQMSSRNRLVRQVLKPLMLPEEMSVHTMPALLKMVYHAHPRQKYRAATEEKPIKIIT